MVNDVIVDLASTRRETIIYKSPKTSKNQNHAEESVPTEFFL